MPTAQRISIRMKENKPSPYIVGDLTGAHLELLQLAPRSSILGRGRWCRHPVTTINGTSHKIHRKYNVHVLYCIVLYYPACMQKLTIGMLC